MRHEAERHLWQRWPGRNFFLCDGRTMTGPTLTGFYFTFGLCLLTITLFNVYSAPFLWDEVSPSIPIICGYFTLMALVFLLRTTFSDPGIIPRAGTQEADLVLPLTSEEKRPRIREVKINGQTQLLKFCETCCIYRPPRASHCRICNNCVEGFDHHCPWVSNCVGKRNYRFFIMFVFHFIMSTMALFLCTLVHLIRSTRASGGTVFDTIKEAPGTIVVLIICFLAFLTVIGLPCFHSHLISEGITTNEFIKRSYVVGRSPFTRGSFSANLAALLCGPRPSSILRLRKPVFDDHYIELEPESDYSDDGVA
eukprot:m.48382 g.48382  ORF g.48382 m.48382 type:complete len:309 (+) comp8912_c0_seq4:491-1417(+)